MYWEIRGLTHGKRGAGSCHSRIQWEPRTSSYCQGCVHICYPEQSSLCPSSTPNNPYRLKLTLNLFRAAFCWLCWRGRGFDFVNRRSCHRVQVTWPAWEGDGTLGWIRNPVKLLTSLTVFGWSSAWSSHPSLCQSEKTSLWVKFQRVACWIHRWSTTDLFISICQIYIRFGFQKRYIFVLQLDMCWCVGHLCFYRYN
jgi:hypothetical protein